MIRYTIPGMTEHPDICLLFAQLIRRRPEMFLPDVAIDSVYGGFAGSRLCAGRNSLGTQMPADQISSIVERYNDAGVACNVTFSSQHATSEDISLSLYDRVILDALAAGKSNGVIVYRDDLAVWVREHYPDLVLIASTTKERPFVEETEQLSAHYDRAVLNYNLTHRSDQLAVVRDPRFIEIMVNEYCTLGCPYRKAHYADISRCQYEGRASSFACMHEPAPQAYGFLQGLIDGDVFLKNRQVRALADRGFEYFKIVGRGLDRYDVIDALLYYLVQPDCWYEVRDFLLRHGYL